MGDMFPVKSRPSTRALCIIGLETCSSISRSPIVQHKHRIFVLLVELLRTLMTIRDQNNKPSVSTDVVHLLLDFRAQLQGTGSRSEVLCEKFE